MEENTVKRRAGRRAYGHRKKRVIHKRRDFIRIIIEAAGLPKGNSDIYLDKYQLEVLASKITDTKNIIKKMGEDLADMTERALKDGGPQAS